MLTMDTLDKCQIAMLQEVETTKEKQSVSLCDARLGIITTAKFHPMPANHAEVETPAPYLSLKI